MSIRTCIHVKANGTQCGSPALRHSIHCHFHHKHRRTLKRGIVLSSLNTAAGRQRALSSVLNAVIAGRVDPEIGRTLLYGIQTATNS